MLVVYKNTIMAFETALDIGTGIVIVQKSFVDV